MDPTFGHPLWISSGVVLVVVGFLLFRWARRLGSSDRVASAQREASAGKIFRGGQKPPKASAAGNFRRSMSQFFGIVGFLMMLAGLMAIFLGVFYVGS